MSQVSRIRGGYTDRRGDTDVYTDRTKGDIISLFYFFRNEKNRLKIKTMIVKINSRC
jgi:hypothetical protein